MTYVTSGIFILPTKSPLNVTSCNNCTSFLVTTILVVICRYASDTTTPFYQRISACTLRYKSHLSSNAKILTACKVQTSLESCLDNKVVELKDVIHWVSNDLVNRSQGHLKDGVDDINDAVACLDIMLLCHGLVEVNFLNHKHKEEYE